MRLEKHLEWLEDQLDIWTAEGYIDEQQARVIRSTYQNRADGQPQVQPFGNLALALMAMLLIGGGIVLLVAYNWEDMNRPWRVFFSFMPLVVGQVLYGYAFFAKRGEAAWEETASGFLQLMIGASLSLISQTYHIMGSTESFLISWIALSVPLLFLLPSATSGVLFWGLTTAWAVSASGAEHAWYWAMVAVSALQLAFRSRDTLSFVLLGWAMVLCFPIGYFASIGSELAVYLQLAPAMWLVFFLLLGLRRIKASKGFWKRPFLYGGRIGLTVIAMVMTYDWDSSPFGWSAFVLESVGETWRSILHFGLFLLLFAAILHQRYKVSDRLMIPDQILLLYPLILLAVQLLHWSGPQWPALMVANGAVVAMGIAWLSTGIRQESLLMVNLGMVILLVLLVLRFFDSDLSMLIKGLVFIGLGIAFLSGNRYLSRRFSKKST